MKKRVKIKVGSSHIKKGESQSTNTCPVAWAIRGRFRTEDVEVWPDRGGSGIVVDGQEWRVSKKEVRTIERYDITGKMNPHIFNMTPIEMAPVEDEE